MAQTTIKTLIPYTPHPGTTGVAATVNGDPQQAGSYYLANNNLQTISWSITQAFSGVSVIQATLVAEPTEDDWFDIYQVTSLSGFQNVYGNFVWVRAKISDWTTGTINLITMSY